MATMNILLPDPMHDLIHRDQETRQQRILQEAAIEGLKSGISHRSMDDILKEAKSRLNITLLEQLRSSMYLDYQWR